MWYIHTAEYWLAIKRNEVLQATTQLNFKNIKLHERSQSEYHILCASIYMKSTE